MKSDVVHSPAKPHFIIDVPHLHMTESQTNIEKSRHFTVNATSSATPDQQFPVLVYREYGISQGLADINAILPETPANLRSR